MTGPAQVNAASSGPLPPPLPYSHPNPKALSVGGACSCSCGPGPGVQDEIFVRGVGVGTPISHHRCNGVWEGISSRRSGQQVYHKSNQLGGTTQPEGFRYLRSAGESTEQGVLEAVKYIFRPKMKPPLPRSSHQQNELSSCKCSS